MTPLSLAGVKTTIPSNIDGTNFAELLINPASNKIKKPEGLLLMLVNSRSILTDKYTLCLQENEKQWDKKRERNWKKYLSMIMQMNPYQ
jgi:hypothetical protein